MLLVLVCEQVSCILLHPGPGDAGVMQPPMHTAVLLGLISLCLTCRELKPVPVKMTLDIGKGNTKILAGGGSLSDW